MFPICLFCSLIDANLMFFPLVANVKDARFQALDGREIGRKQWG